MGKPKTKKTSRDFVEDIDIDVDETKFDEEHVVHNKRKFVSGTDSAVMPKDAHRFADETEDFEEEERQAQEMARSMRKRLAEDDYAVGGISSKIAPRAQISQPTMHKSVVEAVARDFQALSSEDRLAFLKREAPELLAMLDEVKRYLDEVKQVSEPLHNALHNMRKSPDQKQVLAFVETKMQLMLSYCMHVTFYLLLKTEGKQVKGHPVLDRLVELRVYLEKLWPLEEKLQYTLNKLLSTTSKSELVNLDNLRPVKSQDTELYRPIRTVGVADEGKERRQARKAAREAAEIEKEEESLMTRFQRKKGTEVASFDKVRPADEGYHEDADQYFSKLVGEDDNNDGLSLMEKLRSRQQAISKPPKSVTVEQAPDEEDADDMLGDVTSQEDEEGFEFDDLLDEQRERDEHADRVKTMVAPRRVAKEVDRRKIGSRIESHRGLTKARPKDRKTPRTAQRRKFERGMQKVKSQVKTVAPEPQDGFSGVRALRPNVTHSTKYA